MPTIEQPVRRLIVNSSAVTFSSATLYREQDALPSGEPGSMDWRVEVVNGTLPEEADNLLVDVRADGGTYSGAAQLAADELGESGGTVLLGNGPLLEASDIETAAAGRA